MNRFITPLLFLLAACGTNSSQKEKPAIDPNLKKLELASNQISTQSFDGAEATLRNVLINSHDTAVRNKAQRMLAETISLKEALAAYNDSIRKVKIMRQDSTRTALLKYFRVRKDEFNGTTFYTPKSVPEYASNNFYLYVGTTTSNVPFIRFKVRYKSDNWLFAKNIKLKCGDRVHEIPSGDWERDNGGGFIWEWMDRPLRAGDIIPLLDAVKNPSSIRLTGNKYYDDRKLSETERADIKRALDLYEALGGETSSLPLL